MKRWTRDAKEGIQIRELDAPGGSGETLLGHESMHAVLYASAMELVSMASSSRPSFDLAIDHITRAKHALSEMTVVTKGTSMLLGPEIEEDGDECNEETDGATPLDEPSNSFEHSPLDEAEAPPRVRSRGRPRTSRFKSPVEIPPSRRKMKVTESGGKSTKPSKQKCRICGSADHLASKCPENNVAEKPVKPRKCHACGEEGHYRNTCGRKSSYYSSNK